MDSVIASQTPQDLSAGGLKYVTNPIQQAENTVGNLVGFGNSQNHVGHNFNFNNTINESGADSEAKADKECLRHLRITDPEADKLRIEKTKGGLLRDSYRWILRNKEFQHFWEIPENRLLWIKGDPGKGKTMLLCGIIDELKITSTQIISYFFCQSTESRLNNTTSVIRGLLWLLCRANPTLTSCVRESFEIQGQGLFQDQSALESLDVIFDKMLRHPCLTEVVFIVDALDECSDRDQLIGFIIKYSRSFNARWIVSSRNWPDIENRLQSIRKTRVSLELNKESVSLAVDSFIKHKVEEIAKDKQYDAETEMIVRETLLAKANGTFLWAALVCKALASSSVNNWNIRDKLKSIPEGLEGLYERMLDYITTSTDADICREILAITCIAFRPITLNELRILVARTKPLSNRDLEKLIGGCGSFLTVDEGTIYFVHQSAQGFLIQKASAGAFSSTLPSQHRLIFRQSLDSLKTLRRDIYGLNSPGVLISDVTRPAPDPLSCMEYSCIYWVDHFEKAGVDPLSEHDAIDTFLRRTILCWIEALSLLKSTRKGIKMINEFINIVRGFEYGGFNDILEDAQRFLLSHYEIIQGAPLQLYASALIFSPSNSQIRKLYQREEPGWIALKPNVPRDWDACIQTYVAHPSGINFITISPDGQWLASGSNSVKIWDMTSGQLLYSLEVNTCALGAKFSGDDQKLDIFFVDRSVLQWDIESNSCTPRQPKSGLETYHVILSSNGRWIACVKDISSIEIWDLATINYKIFHTGQDITVLSFSADGHQLAWSGLDGIIRVMQTTTGHCLWKLGPHDQRLHALAFSTSHLLASASNRHTINIWDLRTGTCLEKLEPHSSRIWTMSFLENDRMLATGSFDGSIVVWYVEERRGHALRGSHTPVTSLAYLAEQQLLVAGFWDGSVKIWDLKIISGSHNFDYNASAANNVEFLNDGTRLVSSDDQSIKLWDPFDGICKQTLRVPVLQHIPSATGQLLISVGYQRWRKPWEIPKNTITGAFSNCYVAALSPDSRLLVFVAYDGSIMMWDFTRQAQIRRISSARVHELSFSPNNLIIMFSNEERVTRWEISKDRTRVLTNDHPMCKATLSSDCQWLADVTKGTEVQNLKIKKLRQILGDNSILSKSSAVSLNGWWLVISSGPRIFAWDLRENIPQRAYFELHKASHTLQFDLANPSRLRTDFGAIDLDIAPGEGTRQNQDSPIVKKSGYGLSSDAEWIVKDDERILWLPVEYRTPKTTILGSTLALVNQSGCLIIMRFDEQC